VHLPSDGSEPAGAVPVAQCQYRGIVIHIKQA
jgi:hypothetical protein